MTDSNLVKIILFGFFSFGIVIAILAALFSGYRRNKKQMTLIEAEEKIRRGERLDSEKPVGPQNRTLRM